MVQPCQQGRSGAGVKVDESQGQLRDKRPMPQDFLGTIQLCSQANQGRVGVRMSGISEMSKLLLEGRNWNNLGEVWGGSRGSRTMSLQNLRSSA